MMRRFKKYLFTLLAGLSLLIVITSEAQVKVQVVSQQISREIPFSPGMSMMISGEHAEIYCGPSTRNAIEVDITIISKNEDRSEAETDLKKMKWLVEVKGNVCYVRNFIELQKGDAMPESMLKAIFNIRLPQNCALNIKNSFGKTELDSLSAGITIKSEYGPLSLNKIEGNLSINSLFSDITATTVIGVTSITSNWSNINLIDASGQITLTSSSGNIFLESLRELKSFRIDGISVKLDAEFPGPEYCRLLLDLKTTKLSIPVTYNLNYTENDKSHVKANYNEGKPLPLVHFILENSTLNINQPDNLR